MGIGGGEPMMQPTVRFSRHDARIPFFFLLGPYFRAAPSENQTIGLITGGKTKEPRGFAHKGIPRWSLLMIVIPVLHTRMQPALGQDMSNSPICFYVIH